MSYDRPIDSIDDLRERFQEAADEIDRNLFGMTEAEFRALPAETGTEN